MKKVKIIRGVPVAREHGIARGRVFEVSRMAKAEEAPICFVVGDQGLEVGLLRGEFEVLPEEGAEDA